MRGRALREHLLATQAERHPKVRLWRETVEALRAHQPLTPEQVALWDEVNEARKGWSKHLREPVEVEDRSGTAAWLEECERIHAEYLREWHEYVVKVEDGEAGGCRLCTAQMGKIDRGLGRKWRQVCDVCRGEAMKEDIARRKMLRWREEWRKEQAAKDQPKGETDG